MENDKKGDVYVAIFDAMPNLCKIGKSKDATVRIIDAIKTGFLPGKFRLRWIAVKDRHATETKLHEYFADFRYESGHAKEWFYGCQEQAWNKLPTLPHSICVQYPSQEQIAQEKRAEWLEEIFRESNRNS